MKFNFKQIFTLATLSFLALANTAYAQTVASGPVGRGLRFLSPLFPVTRFQSIPEFIAFVIQLLLLLAGGVAVLFVIIGGFWYITSAGNEETATKGKKAVINSLIGIILILLSYLLVSVIVNTVLGYNTLF